MDKRKKNWTGSWTKERNSKINSDVWLRLEFLRNDNIEDCLIFFRTNESLQKRMNTFVYSICICWVQSLHGLFSWFSQCWMIQYNVFQYTDFDDLVIRRLNIPRLKSTDLCVTTYWTRIPFTRCSSLISGRFCAIEVVTKFDKLKETVNWNIDNLLMFQ